MDPATWDERRLAITLYGADPAPLTPHWPGSDEGRKSEAHSATGTPYPIGNPAIPDQPTFTYPRGRRLPLYTGPPTSDH
jgi:hypothetical protein